MFLQSSEYLRELYLIKVLLIHMISLSFFCLLQTMLFLPLSSLHSLRDTSFLSVSYSDWHVYSLYLFFLCFIPTGLRRMCQLDYLNLWRYLWRQSLILSFLVLETEMKDNRMKRSSHNALLRLQHHRITIHITDAVDGLRKKKSKFWAIFVLTWGYYIQFSINKHHKLLSRSGPVRTITKWIIIIYMKTATTLIYSEQNPNLFL